MSTLSGQEIGKRWPIGCVRYVHAKRARKLRRRGEDVRGFGRTSTGRQIYAWFPGARHV